MLGDRLVDKAVFPYLSNHWTDHYQIFNSCYSSKINTNLSISAHLHNGNHGNQIHHTTNAMHTGERRASTIIICFVLFNFVYYVGNMLFCAMNIFSSR